MSEGRVIPAQDAVAVTPSDSGSHRFRALYIGGDGDVSVDTKGGSESVVFVGVLAGTILPVEVVRVNSTDTTATNIVGLV